MNDYARIAAVIRYLDAHQAEQPGLAALARRARLSPHHFHRLFASWAGITPKDFLQCLTLAHARARLRAGASVLDAALDAGLSGPGRLHDLCVTLEAATPGELKRGGAGWTLDYGFADTPFGVALLGRGPRGLCHLSFADTRDRADALRRLRAQWPRAVARHDPAAAAALARRVFTPPRTGARRPLQAFVAGTAFQVRVWRALLQVPEGALVSYGTLAAAVGRPSAARAVGAAVGRNPLAYLIPCHRVIRETGVIGNYRWDPVRKRAMLAWESGRGGASRGSPGTGLR